MAAAETTPERSSRKCSVDGCENKFLAKGYCGKHWQRLNKYGDVTVVKVKPLPPTCAVDGCSRKPHTRLDGRPVCNMHWLRLHATGQAELQVKPPSWSTCAAPDCDLPARTRHGMLCEMHYMRQRRRGSLEPSHQRTGWRATPNGYICITDPDHPVSTPSGHLFQHRAVLWDKIGVGPHPCHWCGVSVNWLPGSGTKAGALVVDHLDDDPANNDPSNLAPSCHGCNCTRALAARFGRAEH